MELAGGGADEFGESSLVRGVDVFILIIRRLIFVGYRLVLEGYGFLPTR